MSQHISNNLGPATVKPNYRKGRCGRKQLSCQECKRSRLKCDLRFPCSKTCVKKGCANICPGGSLIPTKSNVHLKSKNESLQESVRRLQARSRALENALRDTYGRISSSPHPLLQKRVTSDIESLQHTNEDNPQNSEKYEVDGLLGAFGSLAISAKGQTRFNGSSSSVEVLLRSIMPDDKISSILPSSVEVRDNQDLPPCIDRLVNAFPYGSTECNDEMKKQLMQLLPSQKSASHLSSIYFKSVTFFFPPIDESDFIANILLPVYMKSQEALERYDSVHFHKVSVLFIVLACGTILEDESDNIDAVQGVLSNSNTQADLYFRLSRAAFSAEALGNKSNTWTVASLLVMMNYSLLVEVNDTEKLWLSYELILRTSYMIGLHRDPSHWGLNESESQRRRDLFWEAFSTDLWISISYGRPATLNIRYTDCRFERDMEPGIDRNGETELGFRAYIHRVMAFYVSPLSLYMFSVGQLSYGALLKLEEDFRKSECPSQLQCPISGTGEPVNDSQWAQLASRAFQQYFACVYYKETSLLYAHRCYVVRALKMNSMDPVQTKYGASILGSIKSATILLGALRSLLGRHSDKASRMHAAWGSAFCSIFMLGSLVYVCPECSIAKQALHTFEKGVDMFIAFRHKDETGVFSTEILVKLRSHVRRVIFDTKRTSSGQASGSRTDACLSIIRMLEGNSNLANNSKVDHAPPSHAIPERHETVFYKSSPKLPPLPVSPFANQGSSDGSNYMHSYVGNSVSTYAIPPSPGFDIAVHTQLPEVTEWDHFFKADIGLDSIQPTAPMIPPALSAFGELEMFEQRPSTGADEIDTNDDAAWKVFMNRLEW